MRSACEMRASDRGGRLRRASSHRRRGEDGRLRPRSSGRQGQLAVLLGLRYSVELFNGDDPFHRRSGHGRPCPLGIPQSKEGRQWPTFVARRKPASSRLSGVRSRRHQPATSRSIEAPSYWTRVPYDMNFQNLPPPLGLAPAQGYNQASAIHSPGSLDGSDEAMARTARLTFGDQTIELPVIEGSEGELAIDVSELRARTGLITLDSGFANTGVCESSITFVDGEKGVLRYRGIPVDQLVRRSSFVETSFLLIYGRLPTQAELDRFENRLKADAALARIVQAPLRGLSGRRAADGDALGDGQHACVLLSPGSEVRRGRL